MRSSISLIILIVAAFAGNYFHQHLFIGAAFLFGGIATLLTLRLFGLAWGVVAGVAGAAFALFETAGYAAAAGLLVLEPLIVGLALRYGACRNIALVDGAYWLLLGMPLMWKIQMWLLGDLSSAWYFAMIAGFNGIFNALVVGLLLDYLPLWRWVGKAQELKRVALQHLAFNLLASFLVFSAFFVIVLNGRDEVARLESRIQRQLDGYVLEIQSSLVSWLDQRQQLVRRVSRMAERSGSIPTENLQQAADLIKMAAGDLEAVHVGNGDGVAIATSYYGDGAYDGRDLDLSDRPWFEELKLTLRPTVSDVFVGKVSHKPTLSFSVPVLGTSPSGDERLIGYAAVLVRLSEIKNLLEMHVRESGTNATLLDSHRRVIASTRADLAEMGRYPLPGQGAAPEWEGRTGMVASGLSLQQLNDAQYVRHIAVGPDNNWTLSLEIPARPYFADLQQRLVNNLAFMWTGIIIAFLVASVVSRRLVRPLERLVEATTHIKARLLGDEDVRLAHSSVSEIDALVENFTEMTLELNRSYAELGRSNENLEQTVALRTEELTRVNQQLRQHLTEREEYEIALARHSQKLEETTAELVNQKFALDQHSIVGIADPRGRIIYVNDKFCEISQYSREELIGQDHRILNSGCHDSSFFREMWAVIASGKVWRAEICNRNKSGDLYWVDTTIVPFMDASGRPEQYVSIRTDITQRKQAEQALIRARDEAESANRAKSEFLSRMSHEFRTPLNAILGFGQLLESDLDEALTPSQQENVVHITKAGWHLLELVNEVLDLSRIESGKMQFNFTDVLLSDLVQECRDLISPLASEREISIDDRIAPCQEHYVWTDRVRLKQVLLNFLSNAVKYNHHGGLIVLACEQIPGRRLRISVRDTGPGIPEKDLGQLFVAFNRLGADKSEIQGAGIGLAVSKRLVELMDGEVGVSSVEGEGTTFWVDLPEMFAPTGEQSAAIPDTERNEAAQEASGIKPSAMKHCVLYIEDNPANRALVTGIIRQRRPDVELTCEGSAEEGLQAALKLHPDLILMDINLPGISGLDALELLAEFDELRDIPVIAVSADAMPEQIDKCLRAGFRNYLTKPINVGQFLAALDLALDETETRMESI